MTKRERQIYNDALDQMESALDFDIIWDYMITAYEGGELGELTEEDSTATAQACMNAKKAVAALRI